LILEDPSGRPPAPGLAGDATLDDLFRRAVARHPDALALADPPDRGRFTDGAPRRLTYAQADRAVTALAARLRAMGLATDAVVGVQTAGTVESVITLLALLRAGLIAMPLPLLWRRADAAAALGRVGASALIVSGRVGTTDHFALAMHIAADVFAVRHVCGFGLNPPDGVLALDDVFAAQASAPVPLPSIELERAGFPGPAAHLALITWDVTSDGLLPVARSHAELIAGGLAILLESGLAQDGTILTTLLPSSFAALATSVLPWLLAGGALVLHHPFDLATLTMQLAASGCGIVVVPATLAPALAQAGHLTACDRLRSVVAVWRAPERSARSPAWQHPAVELVDVHAFGETGLIAARRNRDGKPAPVAFGTVGAPRGGHGALAVAEVQASIKGTVALRGPMGPRGAFPPGAARTSLPHIKVAPDGFVDTGYGCQVAMRDGSLVVTAPPGGLAAVGGYRFATRDLETIVTGVEPGGTLAALPDAVAGHRLAGAAGDRARVSLVLAELGLNPLLSGAFGAGPRD
jgi:hypothetical protein